MDAGTALESQPDGEEAPEPGGETGTTPPLVWVSSTYFAQGFPYAVVHNLPDVIFEQLGASLQTLGLTSLFHLPWNLKFLWAPQVDRVETKRSWVSLTQMAMAILCLIVAALVPTAALMPIGIAFLLMAVFAATQDIAIDGYYMEALDADGQSRWVGYRAAAYRLAALSVTGGLIYLGAQLGWWAAMVGASAALGLLSIFHLFRLPRVESQGEAWASLVASTRARVVLCAAAGLFAVEAAWSPLRGALGTVHRALEQAEGSWAFLSHLAKISFAGWVAITLLSALLILAWRLPRIRARLEGRDDAYAAAFADFLGQKQVATILAFVILFRVGESFLLKMRWPFLARVVELSAADYAIYNGTIGAVATMVATILGGALIARHGLRRWIWPFVLAQNLLNLLFAAAAALPDPTALGSSGAALIIGLEHAGEGLGTAVFMVYLMRACDPRHKAAHMAILTALMSIGVTLAGVFSGILAAWVGYAPYFVFTFIATVPAMLLIPRLPYLDGRD